MLPYSLLAWALMSLFNICVVIFITFMALYEKKSITLIHILTVMAGIAFAIAPFIQVVFMVLSIGGAGVLCLSGLLDWASKIVVFKRK